MEQNERQQQDQQDVENAYDIAIVGGGVVGLAILRQATLQGWRCCLVERQPDLLECASGSNSGIVCTGVDASPNTLERALIRDAISQIRPYLRQMNIPHRECGSLVCQWDWDTVDDGDGGDHEKKDDNAQQSLSHQHQHPQHTGLQQVLAESHEAGDTHAQLLSSVDNEVQRLEPNINLKHCRGAVHIPGEIVVDPWLYSISLVVQARELGAQVYTNFEVDAAKTMWDGELWTVVRRQTETEPPQQHQNSPEQSTDIPSFVHARIVVNATGLWCDTFQQQALERPSSWMARPRRGQYRIFRSTVDPKNGTGTTLKHPIQPIPTQETKGIFVFSTMYDQIVVGPTALDQESKTDKSIDPKVAKELDQWACRVLPDLDPKRDLVGEYVGIRPGTDQRDYQIHVQYDKKWVSVAGIRSTGLTASLGIGRHVCHLLSPLLAPLHQNGSKVAPRPPTTKLTPLPDVENLINDFNQRGNGRVDIHGFLYRVTHPITYLGWSASKVEALTVNVSQSQQQVVVPNGHLHDEASFDCFSTESLVYAMARPDLVVRAAINDDSGGATADDEVLEQQQDSFAQIVQRIWDDPYGPSKPYLRHLVNQYVKTVGDHKIQSEPLMDLMLRVLSSQSSSPASIAGDIGQECCYQSFWIPRVGPNKKEGFQTLQQKTPLRIRVFPKANDVALRLWEGGAALAEFWLSCNELGLGDVQNKNEDLSVCELGAGVGATSLALLSQSQGESGSQRRIRHVYATDYTKACLDNLNHNIEINNCWIREQEESGQQRGNNPISAHTLDWTWFDDQREDTHDVPAASDTSNQQSLMNQAKMMLATCNVLLAADVAYDPVVLKSLASTIHFFLTNDSVSSNNNKDSQTPNNPSFVPIKNKFALLATTRRNLKTFERLKEELTRRGIHIERVGAESMPQQHQQLLQSPPILFPCQFHQPRSDVWFTKLTLIRYKK